MKVIGKEIPQWQKDINDKIQAKRKQLGTERFEKESAIVNERLTAMLGVYFDNYQVDDEDSNKITFDTLNDEWKDLCQKWEITFKGLVLDYEAFSKAIELNLADPKMQEVIAQMRAEKCENSEKINTLDQ